MSAARRTTAWLIALPLTAIGTFVTHHLLPASADPVHASHAEHAGAATAVRAQGPGLGFFCSVPFLLSCLGLLVLILGVRILQRRHRGPELRVSAWPFAVMVPVGFFLHHHLEHLVSGDTASLAPLLEPRLLVGLVLQLPFALLAYLLVTVLLRVADRLITALSSRRFGRVRPARRTPPPAFVPTPRLALLARAAAPRAPPLAA